MFGLGSTLYPHFCSFAHYVDECLYSLGGKRILPLQTGDELNGLDQSFKEWSMEVFSVACEAFGVSQPTSKPSSSSKKSNNVNATAKSSSSNSSTSGWSKGKFRLNYKNSPVNEDLRSGK